MSMIGKLKQFKDLREQGKKMQNALADESATATESGISLTMDGNLQLVGVAIDEDLLQVAKKEKLQEAIKSAHKSVLKKMQRIMATKMKDMGGFDLPGFNS